MVMTLALLAASAVGLSLGLLLTPLALRLALRCDLVDQPDGRRKLHTRAVPVAGGPVILLATLAAFGLALLMPGPLQEACQSQAGDLAGLLLGAVLISALGVLDDFGLLRGRHKLLGQLVAVAAVITSGVCVRGVHFFGWDVELGLLAVPFTAFLLLGAVNSLNLIDGMDGLLTTVALIISAAMAVMAVSGGQWATACVAAALAGALLGFLRYNLPPARVFLGDSGSMLVGLVVGVLAVRSSLKGPATVALTAPTALLTIPIFDTMAAILRRKLTGRSLYSTDRAHLHHCLLRHGLTSRRALLLVAGLCLLTGAGTLASVALKNELFAVVSALTVVATLVATRLFGNAEILLLRRRAASLLTSFFRGPAPGEARAMEVRLQGSADWGELWITMTAAAEQLHLRSLRLDVNAPAIGEGYHARWDVPGEEADETGMWLAAVPLEAQGRTIGRLQIVGSRDGEPVLHKFAALAELVQQLEVTASLITGPAWAGVPQKPLSGPHPRHANGAPTMNGHAGG
jgi:UDP-GlcNAc:undecaprenyl-phosphate GlcNAc-1-phosphate transferase